MEYINLSCCVIAVPLQVLVAIYFFVAVMGCLLGIPHMPCLNLCIVHDDV
jgi:hypothetical protein